MQLRAVSILSAVPRHTSANQAASSLAPFVPLWLNFLFAALAAGLLTACAQTGPRTENPREYVTMQTSLGDIVVELDRQRAPITVANFLSYVDRRAYDGAVFHRVIPTFVIQAGGHDADLTDLAERDAATGNPDKPITNEWQNGLKNVRGAIAMAREAEADSATRQFYINVADNPRLDTAREQTGNAGYAVFGRVIAGMDVVDLIRQVPTHDLSEDMKNVPIQPVTIRAVRRAKPPESR